MSKLFDYLYNELGVTVLGSQLSDIEHIVLGDEEYIKRQNEAMALSPAPAKTADKHSVSPNSGNTNVKGWVELDFEKPKHGQLVAMYLTDENHPFCTRYADGYLSEKSNLVRWLPLPPFL